MFPNVSSESRKGGGDRETLRHNSPTFSPIYGQKLTIKMSQTRDGFANVDTYCYVILGDLDKINILSLPSDKKKN